MKVLFFTYDFPYPTNSGGKNRAYNLLKNSNKNVEYILFSFYRQIPEQKSIEAIEALGVNKIRLFKRNFPNISSVISSPTKMMRNLFQLTVFIRPAASITKKLYYNESIKKELLKTIKEEKIDIVHFESLYTAYYLSDMVKQLGVKQIFGTENVEYQQYKDFAQKKVKKILVPLYLFEAWKIEKDEKKLLKKADVNIAVSETDAKLIEEIAGKNAEIIPNGVDLDYFSFKKFPKKLNTSKERKLLFIGNFSYFPNIDGIKNFYTNVFSNMREHDIRLIIVGQGSTQLRLADDKRVETYEFIDDVRKMYQTCDVFVFPVKIGGGTNFKLLEAMASGIPIVAYEDKVSSLPVVDNKHLLIAKDEQAFRNNIEKLLQDTALTQKIASTARELVEKNYSWEKIGTKMNKIWTG